MLKIDLEMQEIVFRLNNMGLYTSFCCQGNHIDGRILIAYVGFSEGVVLPSSLINFGMEQGWQVDRDYSDPINPLRFRYSVHSVDSDFPEDYFALEKRNKAFIAGWKSFLNIN